MDRLSRYLQDMREEGDYLLKKWQERDEKKNKIVNKLTSLSGVVTDNVIQELIRLVKEL